MCRWHFNCWMLLSEATTWSTSVCSRASKHCKLYSSNLEAIKLLACERFFLCDPCETSDFWVHHSDPFCLQGLGATASILPMHHSTCTAKIFIFVAKLKKLKELRLLFVHVFLLGVKSASFQLGDAKSIGLDLKHSCDVLWRRSLEIQK